MVLSERFDAESGCSGCESDESTLTDSPEIESSRLVQENATAASEKRFGKSSSSSYEVVKAEGMHNLRVTEATLPSHLSDTHCQDEKATLALQSGVKVQASSSSSNGPNNTSPASVQDSNSNTLAFPSSAEFKEVAVQRISQNYESQSPETFPSSALGRAEMTGGIDVTCRSRNSPSAMSSGQSFNESVIVDRLDAEGQASSADNGSGALQWLQALELQVGGACRADERLRPLLRWNVSCFGADGRLLAHLGQHFKARELAMLARCLCAPLLSIRVGKVTRHGRFLRPTASRGFLTVTVLPCSEMRLSFIGDNGAVERIAVTGLDSEHSPVILEALVADPSGRTFVLRLPGSKYAYFWQSEKSKPAGDLLLAKMKDILQIQPTLSQLTGIHQSRLNLFASYLRTALLATSPSTGFPQPCSAASLPLSSVIPAGSVETNVSASTCISSAPVSRHSSTGALPAHFFNSQPNFLERPVACLEDGETIAGQILDSEWGTNNHVSHGGMGSLTRDQETYTEAAGGSPTSLMSPSSISSGSSGSGSLNTASWSTRTSLSTGSHLKPEASSLSVGLYTSRQADPCISGQNLSDWKPHKSVRQTFLDLPGMTCPQTVFPISTGEPAPSMCSLIPPAFSRGPISTSSLRAPYYCPCPLSIPALPYTFVPPYLPASTIDSGIPPSSTFLSVCPPAALFPPSSLSLHELSISPVQLPTSPLASSSIPMQASSHLPFSANPISHFPILNLRSPNQGLVLRGASADHSTGFSAMLPACSENRFLQRLGCSEGQEFCSVNMITSSSQGMTQWVRDYSQRLLSAGRPPACVSQSGRLPPNFLEETSRMGLLQGHNMGSSILSVESSCRLDQQQAGPPATSTSNVKPMPQHHHKTKAGAEFEHGDGSSQQLTSPISSSLGLTKEAAIADNGAWSLEEMVKKVTQKYHDKRPPGGEEPS